MARSISEQELQLKKRARRRLVGAVVLVSAVAVVLPMVLDSEPKPVRQNVDIHIPSPEAGEFKPKTSEAPQQPVAPIKGLPEAPPSDTAPAASPSTPSAQASAQVRMDTAPKPEAPAAKGSGATDRDTSSTAKDRTESARAFYAATQSRSNRSAAASFQRARREHAVGERGACFQA